MGLLVRERAIRAMSVREVVDAIYEGQTASSGEKISEGNALQISDVYKCVRVKSDAFAVLPLKLRELVSLGADTGAVDARGHYLWPILHDQPNADQTSFQWRRGIMRDLMIAGNHYSFIERTIYDGKIKALRPLVAANTQVFTDAGVKKYRVYSTSTSKYETFEAWEILHLYGHGYNGYCGASPIRLQMEALGLAKAAERFGGAYFGQGSKSSVIATHPGQLTAPGRERLRASIEAQSKSKDNWHRVVVLEEGVKLEKLTIPNNEAQFMETRSFQRAEIAGMYGVPLHKIGDLERSTNNNIEHQDLEWHRDGVMPELVNFEQEARAKLLTPQERRKYFVQFEFKAQMRGDTASQTDHITRGIFAGVYSPNEGRGFLGLNPYEGGDLHVMQVNMIPVAQLAEYYEGRKPKGTVDESGAKMGVTQMIKAYRIPWRNEIGRAIARDSAKDRERSLRGGLQAMLFAIADVLELEADDAFAEFAERYMAAMAQRAAKWTLDQADSIAEAELTRAVNALQERQP